MNGQCYVCNRDRCSLRPVRSESEEVISVCSTCRRREGMAVLFPQRWEQGRRQQSEVAETIDEVAPLIQTPQAQAKANMLANQRYRWSDDGIHWVDPTTREVGVVAICTRSLNDMPKGYPSDRYVEVDGGDRWFAWKVTWDGTMIRPKDRDAFRGQGFSMPRLAVESYMKCQSSAEAEDMAFRWASELREARSCDIEMVGGSADVISMEFDALARIADFMVSKG